MSQAPGFSGTPTMGQDSSAATSASWVSSSASGTSRSIRDSVAISRGCTTRQLARMTRSMSAAVIAADRGGLSQPSGVGGYPRARVDLADHVHARRRKCPQLTRPFPARHMVEVQLHEFLGHRQGLLLVAQLEYRIAADHLLGLHERAVDDAELAIGDM